MKYEFIRLGAVVYSTYFEGRVVNKRSDVSRSQHRVSGAILRARRIDVGRIWPSCMGQPSHMYAIVGMTFSLINLPTGLSK